MRYPINVVDVEEASFRSPEYTGVVLDSIALSRGIHDAEHLFQVVRQKLRGDDVSYERQEPLRHY